MSHRQPLRDSVAELSGASSDSECAASAVLDVSVLITYHDEGELLAQCLDSILRQRPTPRELLVYDDASRARAAVDVVRDPRVRVITGDENVGPAQARNRLLSLATSQYVHFHDADDWFNDGWSVSIARALADAPDVVVTEVDALEAQEWRRSILGLPAAQPTSMLKRAIEGSLLVPSTTIRRELALAIGGFDSGLVQSEDYEFNIRLFSHAKSVEVVREGLVSIRVHAGSRSRARARVYADAVAALRKTAQWLHPSVWPDAAEASARMGSSAYQQGDTQAGKAGFAQARAFGGARYLGYRPSYRWVARLLGQEAAEWIASRARSFLRWLR